MATVTIKQKIEYLESYAMLGEKVADLQARMEQLMLDRRCPSVRYSDMPSGSGGSSDLSDYAADLMGLIEKYEMTKEERNWRRAEIIVSINTLENEKERKVLYARYIKGLFLAEIAREMQCSLSTVKRKRDTAIASIDIFDIEHLTHEPCGCKM